MATSKTVFECRICHCGAEEGILNNYCGCTGTNGPVHSKCILKWLAYSGRNSCEICKSPYEIQLGGLKSCRHWHLPSSEREHDMIRGVIFIVSLLASICNISIFLYSIFKLFKHQPLIEWEFTDGKWWEVSLGLVFTVLPPTAIAIFTGCSLIPYLRLFCLANRTLIIIPKDQKHQKEQPAIAIISNEFMATTTRSYNDTSTVRVTTTV